MRLCVIFVFLVVLVTTCSGYSIDITQWSNTYCNGVARVSTSVPEQSCVRTDSGSFQVICSFDYTEAMLLEYSDSNCDGTARHQSVQAGNCARALDNTSVIFKCPSGPSAFIIVWAIFVPLCVGFVVVCLVVNRWNRSRQLKQPPPHIESVQL